MSNLKTPILILCISLLTISSLNAQAPNLIVEGWAKIEGERLEFTDKRQSNIFIGFDSGNNTDVFAFYNTALGYQAMNKDVDGSSNTAIGYRTLAEHIRSGGNTAIGAYALERDTSGNTNTAIGGYALTNNRKGFSNTASGYRALSSNIEGNNNTASGFRALFSNTEGDNNTASGFRALYSNNIGHNNTATGSEALHENYSGSQNTAFGAGTLFSNYSGVNNTAIGYQAFYSGQIFSNSTAIGYDTNISASNQIRFGNTFITSIGGFEPWTNLSDKRLKKNVKNNIPGLEFITQLKPVSYQLDMDNIAKWQQTPDSLRDFKSEEIKRNIRYSGFLAQEVEATAEEIGYHFSGVDAPKNEGDRYGLRYSQFVVPLVKAVQELNEEKEDTAIKLQKLEEEIATLKALLLNQQQAVELRTPHQATHQTAKLTQNKPNPFNGQTMIDYFIPTGFQQAIIRITDNTGRLVKDVKIQKSGIGQIEIDATLLHGGNYFYSLILDGQLVDSKQMILLK